MEFIEYLDSLSTDHQFHLNVYSLIHNDGCDPAVAVASAAADFGLTGNIPDIPEDADLSNIEVYISIIKNVNDRFRKITGDPSVERALRQYCNEHRIIPRNELERLLADSDWYSVKGTTMNAAIVHVQNSHGISLNSEKVPMNNLN